ncbi:cell wall chitin biosynthesis-related protein [Trichosporon asahii var. asahii CBS 8904]|uniref:Chitin synthase export chaperone n=2 Tax=Trichosporon asahii var. asahii TaxID=189963 RepID=K1VVF1_TRIAC|nr:cell wall chitin biosynthesis-related protein [Trichosporon asahii var. asahii CBS 2479]EJT46454.1 cell wall chitin biosynthesis-related protein [Trichosporon asahii var. asahii CBS 2479]EKD04516.1 cell wall chitin biosynthesis-related protein [Trichosporon asahii var. asahii CBS 8904]
MTTTAPSSATTAAPFKFGSFDWVCERAQLTVCPLLGSSTGIAPTCYARNVQLGTQIVFQPVHIAALAMTLIMLFHVRSKYTAVGRKEIVLFFYIYMFVELLGAFLDSSVIPTSNVVYPWFTAIYAGAIGALYWCLLVNGFVGFQLYEDGTPMSLWGWGTLNYQNTMGLFITYLVYPLIVVVIYIVSQFILVIRTLDDRWVIGDLLFGIGFYVVGCILLLAFSTTICDAISHYLDGVFFFTLCMLFTVMMEDLEFSVGSKVAVWEVKDPLLSGDDSQSAYRGAGGSLVGGYGGNAYYQGGYSKSSSSYDQFNGQEYNSHY